MAKTLLVGCGGTGIKALMSFNRQMAGDAERRYRMWEDVSYLVIDTNRDDIAEFESGIAQGMESVNGRNIRPIYKTVHITNSNALLNDIVHKYIINQKDEDKLVRLRKNWWFDPEGTPYTAIHRRDTASGAAQCPPISYMFMWDYLTTLETVVDNLLDDIYARNNETHSPLEDLQVYLIAGMSGGTGRGTWNLVAFKIRECILRRIPGARVDLPAIFLDSSCYTALTPNSTEKNLSKKVNSITGFSELSAWLAIRDVKKCYDYSLPALVPPKSSNKMHVALSGMTDVIHVHSTTNDPYLQSPVRYAYLVFGNNGRQKLYVGQDRNEYCEMVGVALYALVAHSHQFKGDFCNGMLKLCSFGAVSAEVETVELRNFFNSEIRRVKIEELRKDVGDDDSDLYNKQLCRDFKLGQKTEVNEGYLSALSGEESDNTEIIGLLMGKIRAIKKPLDPTILRKNVFKKQQHKLVKEQMLASLKLAKVNPDVVKEIIGKLLNDWSASLEAKHKVQDESDSHEISKEEKKVVANPITRYLWQLVLKAYRFNDNPSVARAILCVDSLSSSIDDTIKRLPEFDDGSAALMADCLKFSKNQWLVEDWKLFPNPYNESEMQTLTENLMQVYANDMYLSIREPLIELLNEAKAALKNWRKMLGVVDGCLQSAALRFERQTNDLCTGSTTESAYNRLFVKTDMASIDASIPTGTETAKQIRRVFKPIMSREDIRVLLANKDISHVGATKIEEYVKEALCKLFAKSTGKPTDDDIENLTSGFENLFHSNVSIKTAQLDAKFTLEEVLRRNIVYWNKKLDDVHNIGPDAERELQDRFRTYLGLRDDKTDRGRYDYVETEKGVPHMLLERSQGVEGIGPEGVKNRLPVSLMVNCIPWVLFDREDERLGVENLQQTILLPYKLDLAAREKIKVEIKRGSGNDTAIGVMDPSENAGRLNPADRIVAFSSFYVPMASADQSFFDRVVSLQDDLRDTGVLQRVSLAESPDGLGYLGYFEPNPEFERNPKSGRFVERTIGLGFTSPVFVEEPELANRRWRPWKTAVDEAEEKNRSDNFVYEVLAYAFTCSGMTANSPLMVELSNEGWSFPLLKRSSKAKTQKSGKFVLVRKALGVPDGEVCEWDANDQLPCTGITQIVNWLMGKGIPDANGVADSRVTAQGVAVFKRMAAEKAFFEENIIKNLKPANWTSVAKQRRDWIAAEASTKTPILDCDRETWKKILAVAASLVK